ncbi:MAG: ABC transporter permease [Deltaproteobacteria bacterium]|nr:MAG: ABC transporter permease [Deltaproteobacteria bacterium]
MVRSKILSRLVILFALCLLLSLLTTSFSRPENLVNVIRQAAILNILGIGMTLVILTGGIDLSNGAVLALSSCVSAIYLKEGGSILVGILISLAIGLACGLINGWMVARVLIPPFVITYAMMFFARGLAYIVLKGKIIYGFSAPFRFLGAGHLFSIPTPIVLSALILLIFYFLLRYTPFGADLYAVGSDTESSRLSGIKTQNRILWVYTLSGLLSAFAGIIYTSRLNAAEPVIGEFFPLDAIAAVVLGGTLLEGGEGSVIGTMIGALIITVVINGMNLLGIPSLLQSFVLGCVILTMIASQYFGGRLRKLPSFLKPLGYRGA